jgi:RNA polymerase sigma factor (sigma-70 family)
MPTPDLAAALRRLAPDDTPDGELLARYVRQQDEAAFATLVARHGGMVRAVCRRVLRNDADADDAVQATFLVLVRKAASIRDRNGLANWLFGVAHNVALKARQTRTRRAAKEADAPPRPPAAVACDFAELLHSELAKLTAASRGVIVLCDLEGRTIADAARQLGIPAGTVASRLARGRELLAKRLAKHGLSVSAGLLATLFGKPATAAMAFNPTALEPRIHTLATEVTRTMFTTPKLTRLAAVLATVATLGGTLVATGQAGDRPRAARTNAPVPKEKKEAVPDIVGAWVPMSEGGPLEREQLVITFQADGKVKYEQGKQVEYGWYKLGEKKEPAEIEYATPRRANPENNAPPFLGIYKIEDDVLTLCLSEKARSTEFKMADGTLLSGYRRVKAEKREPIKAPAPKDKQLMAKEVLAAAAEEEASIKDLGTRGQFVEFVAAEYARYGETEQANKLFAAAVLHYKAAKSGVFAWVPLRMVEAGLVKEGLAMLDDLIRTDPDHTDEMRTLCWTRLAWTGRLKEMEQMRGLLPKDRPYLATVAVRAYLAAGEFEKAAKAFDKDADAYTRIELQSQEAEALHKAGKTEQALKALKAAEEIVDKAVAAETVADTRTGYAVFFGRAKLALAPVDKRAEAHKTLLATIAGFEDRNRAGVALMKVVKADLAADDPKAATVAAEACGNEGWKEGGLLRITTFHLERGEVKTAVAVIDGLKEPFFEAIGRLRLAVVLAKGGKTAEAKTEIARAEKLVGPFGDDFRPKVGEYENAPPVGNPLLGPEFAWAWVAVGEAEAQKAAAEKLTEPHHKAYRLLMLAKGFRPPTPAEREW